MRLKELYRIERLPVFQNRMFRSADEARDCTRGDVVLTQDLDTGLIFNAAFRPELMQYDADYQNEQAISSVFQRHLQNVLGLVRKHFHGLGLIEVGCGKGWFLNLLLEAGFDATGLDPTYEGDSPRVIKQYFTPETGLRGDGIVLRHVLEHVRDPADFLAKIRDANGGAGKIYIEVPCFDWICRHGAWFDIFYEHVNYFREDDFHRMFGKVHEAGRVFDGQYLYVIADLASLRQPRAGAADAFSFPANFLSTLEGYAQDLRQSRGAGSGRKSVIWGGGSKGVIFSLLMQRAGVQIDHVVDINPAKQGKYLPAAALKVSAPQEVVPLLAPGSDIYVMNSNYLEEIRAATDNAFRYLTVDTKLL